MSVKIIKNEVGCRDYTMPKTVKSRRYFEEDLEHATSFCNPLPTSWFLGVAEDRFSSNCLLVSTVFGHGVVPTFYFGV